MSRTIQSSPVLDVIVRAGFRALLTVPLLGADRIVGALVVRRKQPGEFPKSTVDLLQTFAAQSVLAIQNARLFTEIEEKSRQLEMASQHKSQFLANMSHELRTPLNAILGYTELMLDNVCALRHGEGAGAAAAIASSATARTCSGLINDVLDLSKIEAGQLTLALADYSMKDVVAQRVTARSSRWQPRRSIALKIELRPDLPRGAGDERRSPRCCSTSWATPSSSPIEGEVAIKAVAANGSFTVSVRDIGSRHLRSRSGQDFPRISAG